MSIDVAFTKNNLDARLKRLALAYKKRGGKHMPAQLILVGGAAILARYGFRESTYDVDALIEASSAFKEAINQVSDEMQLPNGWLSTDFMRSASYSPKLAEYSVYYKDFGGVLSVRTIEGAYLVAMKLMAGRPFKHDLSDVIGILYEHEQRGQIITLEQVKAAFEALYGTYDKLPEASRSFIEHAITSERLTALYHETQEAERDAYKIAIELTKQNPTAHEDNLNEVLRAIREDKDKEHSI